MALVQGNFHEVPIGHEFKYGTYVAKKLDASHGEVYFPLKDNEVQYFSPCRWVTYNPLYPQLIRTDTKIRG